MDQPDEHIAQTIPCPNVEPVPGDTRENINSQSLPMDLSTDAGQQIENNEVSGSSSLQNVVGVSNEATSNIMNNTKYGMETFQYEGTESLISSSHPLPAQTDTLDSVDDNKNNSTTVSPFISVNESTISVPQNDQEKSVIKNAPWTQNAAESETQSEYHPHEHLKDKDGMTQSHSSNFMTDLEYSNVNNQLGSSVTEKTMIENIYHPSDGNVQEQELSQTSSYPVYEVTRTDVEDIPCVTPAVKTNDSRYVLSSNSAMDCIATASSCFLERFDDNFLKGCKWSPDGTQIVTNSNDNCLRIFTPGKQTSQCNASMDPTCAIREKSQIYDFCWYPSMASSSPDSCRVACTCSGIPIHMWDSNNGAVVSSYLAYDHCDEITAAYSLCFSPDGSKLFAGYKKCIRIFDTERPGRTSRILKTYDTKTKEGVRGIISCFAFSQDASPIFVAGSYSRHVGVYDYASQQLIYMMQGQQGGVTHVAVSPDGTKLYTGGRKDPEIVCWDMRNTGQVLFTCLRDVQTNQRIYFDLSESGQYLVSGNQDGSVLIWNTLDPGEIINDEVIIKPCFSFLAHQDCVNGVSFNHQQNILATSSGQRHFMDFDDYDSDSSSMSTDSTQSVTDSSLKLWKIPCSAGNIMS